MLRPVESTQRKTRMLAFRVTGSGTAAINEGTTDGTLTDLGVGGWRITFAKAFLRAPVVALSTLTTDSVLVVGNLATSSFDVSAFDATDGTTAKDAIFHALVLGFDAADYT